MEGERMERRTRYDIMVEILNHCRTPRNRTSIVYHCNLNFVMVRDYTDLLIAKGLLEQQSKQFKTTSKGLNILIGASEFLRCIGLIRIAPALGLLG
jgi:predicted transcriptional regulator